MSETVTLSEPSIQDWQGIFTGALLVGTIAVVLLNGYYHLGIDGFCNFMEGLLGPAIGFWFRGKNNGS